MIAGIAIILIVFLVFLGLILRLAAHAPDGYQDRTYRNGRPR
jgi:hypothetical protein